ncbi:DUF4351 domain-containing protein [Magnetococcales bacterium HHB-1]
MRKQEKRTCWHCLVADTLKTLLQPVGIEVRPEVKVIESPKADILLIRRRGKRWTDEQRLLLADGLRDLESDHILAELKVTESLNASALRQTLAYDHFFLIGEELARKRLQSVLISAKTPQGDILEQFGFEPLGPAGVYVCKNSPWCGSLRVILLNKLSDEPHNAPLKMFASRRTERKKAFETIKRSGLIERSIKFGRIVAGLWRLLMKGSMESIEADGITTGRIAELGKDWFEAMVKASPDDDLFSLPRFEKRLEQSRLEGEAKLLQRQLQKKFSNIPSWADKKLKTADSQSLEVWGDRILDASSIEEVFKQ